MVLQGFWKSLRAPLRPGLPKLEAHSLWGLPNL